MSFPAGSFQDIFYSKSNFVPLPMIVRAKGIKMWDDKGNEYIDISSGPVVSNIGHGNINVAKAMAKQASKMDFAYSRVARHQPNIDLTKKVSSLAGKGYERIALSSGGSEGMEIAIKFLRQYSLATGKINKRRIISLSPSYHGSTIATLAITGDKELDPFVNGFAFKAEFIPAPFQYRIPKSHSKKTFRLKCAEALEEKILELGQENVLCFILEPVGGLATGALPIQEDYANKIRKICNKYNVFLVYDEILCGTGRTGKFLASHAWPNAKADIVVLAKGLGSGYTPLGAVLIPDKLCDHLSSLTGFNYSHTYNANPISCATGIAVLKEYEKGNLMRKAEIRGQYLKKKLKILSSKHKTFGDLRGSGLLMAIELVSEKKSKSIFPPGFYPTEKIRICGLKNGLIIYSRKTANSVNGDWFIVAPPLTITEKECDELLERLDATFKDFGKLAEQFMSLEIKKND